MNFTKLVEIARAMKPLRQDYREFHVAAIFKKNKLHSLAWNQSKTHPLALKYYPYPRMGLHAECSAIIKGGIDNYEGYTLAVVRINNNNKVDFSRPCNHCQRLLRDVGMTNIWYSTSSGQFETLTSPN